MLRQQKYNVIPQKMRKMLMLVIYQNLCASIFGLLTKKTIHLKSVWLTGKKRETLKFAPGSEMG